MTSGYISRAELLQAALKDPDFRMRYEECTSPFARLLSEMREEAGLTQEEVIEVEREAWRIAREKAVYQYQQASQLRLVCHNIWDHCSVIANDLRGADAIKELLELLNRKEMGEPEVQP